MFLWKKRQGKDWQSEEQLLWHRWEGTTELGLFHQIDLSREVYLAWNYVFEKQQYLQACGMRTIKHCSCLIHTCKVLSEIHFPLPHLKCLQMHFKAQRSHVPAARCGAASTDIFQSSENLKFWYLALLSQCSLHWCSQVIRKGDNCICRAPFKTVHSLPWLLCRCTDLRLQMMIKVIWSDLQHCRKPGTSLLFLYLLANPQWSSEAAPAFYVVSKGKASAMHKCWRVVSALFLMSPTCMRKQTKVK